MASQQNISETLLRYRVDQASVRSVETASEKIVKQIQWTEDAALTAASAVKVYQQANAAGAAGLNQVAGAQQNATRSVKEYYQWLEALEPQFYDVVKGGDEAARALKRLGDEQDRQSGGGKGGKAANPLGKVGRTLYNLPSVPLGGITSDQLGRVLRGLGGLNVSLATLGAGALITAPALIAVGVALKNYTDQIEAQKKALTGALAAQDNYYEALASFTTVQAQEALAELERTRFAIEQQRNETANALESAFQQAVATFGDPLARVMDAAGQLPTAQLREQLDGIDARYQENIQTSARYRQALEANAFATNDAAAAEEARLELQQAALRRGEALLIENTRFALDLQDQERAERVQMLQQRQAELNTLNALASRYTLTAETAADLEIETTRLELEIESLRSTLQGTGETVADANARIAASQERWAAATDDYFQSISETADAQAKLAQLQMDYVAWLQEVDTAVQKIRDEQAATEAKALDEANDARLKQAEAFEKERLRIEKRYNATIANAIFARDALAAYQAVQARKQELEDLNEANEERLKAIDEAYAKQLKAAEENAAKQLATLRTQYQSENAERQRAIAQARVDLINAQNTEAALRSQYVNLFLTQQLSTQNTSLQTWINWGNQMIGLFQQIGAATAAAISGSYASAQTSAPTPMLLPPASYSQSPYATPPTRGSSGASQRAFNQYADQWALGYISIGATPPGGR